VNKLIHTKSKKNQPAHRGNRWKFTDVFYF